MKTKSPKAASDVRFRRKPLIMALEPRLLLDGAAVAATVDMSTDVAFQEQAAEPAPAPAPAPAPEAVAPVAATEPLPAEPVVVAAAEPDAPVADVAPVDESTDASGDTGESVVPDADTETDTDPLADGVAPAAPRRETAFVDTQVEDYQTLVDSLGPDVEVHLIQAGSNGLEQIAQVLEGQTGIDAVHVYSHGDAGQLSLGSLTLNNDNVGQYADVLARIGQSLADEADLMLYGCFVGADQGGQAFIDNLAQMTGADVAASSDTTGSLQLGGDWDLESSSGQVETAAMAVGAYANVLATPSIDQLDGFTYTEDGGTVQIDSDVSIGNVPDFRGGYLEFALTGGTSTETLGIATVSTASTVSGAISMVGTTVYRGTGSGTEVIGSVDSFYNGQNGQNLRINLSNGFQNGSFQSGTAGDTTITGWTVQTGRIRLDGVYQIAGQATPTDSTYGSGNTTGDSSTGGTFTQTTNLSSYSADYTGDLALEMDTGSASIGEPYGVIRGPAVYSNGAVILEAGDQVSFNWKALSGGDAYDAYGYLIDVNTGQTITILDSTGTSANQETAWANNTVTIQSGQGGVYRFVFVAGSYDFTGGQYLGGKLMIDDVTVTQANPPAAVTSTNATDIARLVTYRNTDQDFSSASRTLTVTASDGSGSPVGSTTATITLARVNDAPSLSGGATLASVAEDTTQPAGATLSSLFGSRFSDPDATNAPQDTLGGVAISADASTSQQGVWEYSTDSGGQWHAVSTVSADGALLLSADSLIRFRPSADWNGAPGSLSVYAVDSSFSGSFTSGATRATFDTTSDGQTSAVSASAASLSTAVTPVNDAPAISSQPVTVAMTDTSAADTFASQSGTVVASDTHGGAPNEGGTVSYGISGGTDDGTSVTSVGTYGTLTLVKATGAYSFVPNANAVNSVPAGAALNETFTLAISDGQGGVSNQAFTVSITPSNDRPVGVDDTASVTESGGLGNANAGTSATGNVLQNDTDVDSTDTPSANGAVVAVRETTAGTDTTVDAGTNSGNGRQLAGRYGTLHIGADGTYQYVVDQTNADVHGLRTASQFLVESFTYTLEDAGGLDDESVLSITIYGSNDAPVAQDDTATAVEAGGVSNGTAGASGTGNVLANDTDEDSVASGETKTVTAVRTGAEGSSGTAGTVGATLQGVYGTLTLHADGSFSYVFDDSNATIQALRVSGQTLSESFTYTTTDTAGLTDQATLTVAIDGRNDNPVAQDDVATALEASSRFNSAAGADATGNVLDNDTDVDSGANGETKTVSDVRSGAEGGTGTAGAVGALLAGRYGNLRLQADGSYTYVIDDNNPDVQALRVSGQNLTDAFTYTVSDAGGLTDQATLTITIDGGNDNPVANDDAGTAVEAGGVFNGTSGADATGNVLDNDTDVDSVASGETKTVTALQTGAEGGAGRPGSLGAALQGDYGRLTLNANGSYVYVVDNDNPAVQALRLAGQTLQDRFTYTVTDAGGLSDVATLTINIEGRNDAPVADATNIDQTWAFGKDFSLDIRSRFSDVDAAANGESFRFTVTGLPSGMTYNAGTGVISGAPTGIGVFTVTITASDLAGASVSRQFVFEVLPPPAQAEAPAEPPPTASPPPAEPLPFFDGAGSSSGLGLGDLGSLPVGTINTGVGGDAVQDAGFLPSDDLSGLNDASQQGTDQTAGLDVPADDAATAGVGGEERVLLSEAAVQVTEYVNADGQVTAIRAAVDVEVGADGRVVFRDAHQKAYDIVGLRVMSINLGEEGLTVDVGDEARGRDSLRYAGELGNGQSLPSWIKVDQNTGEITLTRPPADLEEIIVRVKAIGSDGKMRILDVQLDLADFLKRLKAGEALPEAADEAAKPVGFVPLSEQVQAEVAASDGYGERLMTLFESV